MEVPVKVTRVTANDGQELLYLPKEIVRGWGYGKGVHVLLKIEMETSKIVIEKIPALKPRQREGTTFLSLPTHQDSLLTLERSEA